MSERVTARSVSRRSYRVRVPILGTAVAAFGFGAAAMGADVTWVGPVATPAAFELGANWSTGSVPVAGDIAIINNGGIASLTTHTGDVLALRIGSAAGTTGSMIQNGGSFGTTAGVFMGEDPTSTATYTLDSGMLGGAQFFVASKGSATLNVNGGTLALNVDMRLGDDVGSRGTMNITGGFVSMPGHLLVGHFAPFGSPDFVTGTLNLSGGTLMVGRLNVAQHALARGFVDHSGGTAIASLAMVVAEDSLQNPIYDLNGNGVLRLENTNPGTLVSMFIASDGDGNQAANGGTRATVRVRENGQALIDDHISIGGGTGTMGTLQVSGGTVELGIRATENDGGFLITGEFGKGTVEVSGGNLTADFVQLGRRNNATSEGQVTQTGGTITVRRALTVGGLSGNNNFVAISAGTLNLTGSGTFGNEGLPGLHVARFSVDPGAVTPVTNYSSGRLTIDGTAQVNIAGGLFNSTGFTPSSGPNMGVPLPGGQGLIEMKGGSLSAGSFVNGGIANAGSYNNGGASATYMQSGGVATLGHVSGTGNVAVSGGTMNVNSLKQASANISGGVVQVAAGGTSASTSVVNSLTMSGAGRLDLTNNALVVDYAPADDEPFDTIRSYIVSAYTGGTWSGPGITSSQANASSFAIGYAEASSLAAIPEIFGTVDQHAVLVRLTRYGDADLNGVVNLPDFNSLATNFGGSNKVWREGDFDYNGTVNLADFNRLAANFGLSAGPEGPTPEDWAALAAAVPEPACLGVALMGAAGLQRRRRPR